MRPQMIVVAGPPGAGKSTAFPVSSFGIDHFNIDDQCRRLHGSYWGIPKETRIVVSRRCEEFVNTAIDERRSFAVETTLRTDIATRQAARANANGFRTILFFLAANSPDIHVSRVRRRAWGGGHSSPPNEIEATYQASILNLSAALSIFQVVDCFDTTDLEKSPRWVASIRAGKVVSRATSIPAWVPFENG